MKENKSLKINTALNMFRMLLTVLVPLITFPYASRILDPDGIGKINFSNSVIALFITFALLGTNTYASREAAKIRDNKFLLSKFSKEILIINICSTIISYLIFFILLFTIPKFSNYITIMLICSTKIFFTIFGMEWLYTATEEFKYITIRSFVFQVISLIFLFLFVHEKKDLYLYALFGVISAVGSNICNFINCRHYINLFQKCNLEIKKHLKYIFVFFGMALVTNVYTVLDSTMLGFLTDDIQVGYYSAATKIVKMVIGLLTAVSGILLPRLSYYAEGNNRNSFDTLFYKSAIIFWMLCIPMTIGLYILSEPLLILFSGGKFIQALQPMHIITPIIFSISTASFIGCGLSALRKEKISLIAVCIGAVMNTTINFIFIPKCGASGAAYGTITAESIVMLIQLIYMKKYFFKKKIFKNLIQIFLSTVCMGICICYLVSFFENPLQKIVIGFFSGIIIYSLILFLLHNEYFCEYIKKIFSRINRRKN